MYRLAVKLRRSSENLFHVIVHQMVERDLDIKALVNFVSSLPITLVNNRMHIFWKIIILL